ncbi:hypothetical protein PtB15_6B748 [Puccinia triticina]|nr:hypothetical protein PtB15_6B748 [Puccinia triticina]
MHYSPVPPAAGLLGRSSQTNASRGHNIAVQECGVAHAKSNTCWIIHPWYDSETRPETTQEL